MQLYEGTIKSWKGDKGFGFIQPNGGGKDVFIHISDLQHNNYHPNPGDQVCYKTVCDQSGKTRAYDAQIKTVEISQRHRKKTSNANRSNQNQNKNHLRFIETLLIWLTAAIPFGFSISLIIQHRNVIPFFTYILLSLSIFLVYAIDKTKAHKNQWRIPEQTLHLLELLGGWPGALIAQRTLRHKTKKSSFQAVFWVIVIIHITTWVALTFLLPIKT